MVVNSYIAPSKYMANSDLTWETTITRNVGLDFTTLGGRLSGTIEGYWNNTKRPVNYVPDIRNWL